MDYNYICPDYLISVTGGDREAIKEIIEMFRVQVKEISSEMRKLLDSADYYNLGLLAHKAKSSVAIMGMESLAGRLKNFELQAKAGINIEAYPGYISDYERETEEALKELERFAERP